MSNIKWSEPGITSTLPGADHRLVSLGFGRQKTCKHCRQLRARTRTGLRIFTRYKCAHCDVALCNPHTSDRVYPTSKQDIAHGQTMKPEVGFKPETEKVGSLSGNVLTEETSPTYGECNEPSPLLNLPQQKLPFRSPPSRYEAAFGYLSQPPPRPIGFERGRFRMRPPIPGFGRHSSGMRVPTLESGGFRQPFHAIPEQKPSIVQDIKSQVSGCEGERPSETSAIEPTEVKKQPVVLKGIDSLPGHKIVRSEVKNGKRCVYCQVHRIRTSSGWRVKTNYKCETCDVALCASEVSDRNCFLLHHKEMFGEEIIGDKTS